MAWRCSGQTNAELVEKLWSNRLIITPAVKAAFLKVDRGHYAPSCPYEDSPQPIGHEATISAPHMHAIAVQTLLPAMLPSATRPAPRVLDIGSGSGYLTHLMAELVGERGVVVGLEHIPALRDLGMANMAKTPDGKAYLDSGRARFRLGDGRKGWREEEEEEEEEEQGDDHAWDAIHVGASAVEVHAELVDQLRAPGMMFIPVNTSDGGDQFVWKVVKDPDGKVQREKMFGVRYVPLTDAPQE